MRTGRIGRPPDRGCASACASNSFYCPSPSMRCATRQSKPLAWGALCLAAFVALSCKRDLDTGPGGRRIAGQPLAKTVEVSLGTFRIPIPVDNSDPNHGGAQPDVATGIIVPAGTYYRIRVQGTVTVSINPDAQAAYPDATFPAVGSYGPGGTTGGELTVWPQYCTSGGCGPANLLNLQGGTSAPDSAYSDILYAPTQTEIHVSRTGIAAGIGGPNGSFGKYRLESQQDVTVMKLTDFVHLNASPAYVKANQQVRFTASRDDGGRLDMGSWEWRPSVGSTQWPCGTANPCLMNVPVSGTMIAHSWAYGDASASVVVYSNFTLVADKNSMHAGDTVTFTPLYDGQPSTAARWRWVAADSTAVPASCVMSGDSCRAAIHGSGTMWAYTSLSGGDSAAANVSVLRRRILSLSPAGTAFVDTGATVTFVGSAEGATIVNATWSSGDGVLADRRPAQRSRLGVRQVPTAPLRDESSGVESSTCVDGVTSCTDEVMATYTRTITATVDDSVQSASTVVQVGSTTEITSDSTCFDLGGACWADDSTAAGPVGPTYVAPPFVTRVSFKLDFTDQEGDLHIFTLSDTRFTRVTIVKTTSKYVDALYSVDQESIGSQSPSVPGEVLIYARLIPVRSTLVETAPGNYTGGFAQNGKSSGTFWGPIR